MVLPDILVDEEFRAFMAKLSLIQRVKAYRYAVLFPKVLQKLCLGDRFGVAVVPPADGPDSFRFHEMAADVCHSAFGLVLPQCVSARRKQAFPHFLAKLSPC